MNSDESHSVTQGDNLYPVETVFDRKTFNSKRLAGIEVEYTAAGDFSYIKDFCRTWGAGVHEDSSCGWEVVTAPAAGDYLVKQTNAAATALADAGAACDNNCGVHVHVDARDYTWNEMAILLKVWRLIEAPMYVLAGARRRNEHYCKPYGHRLDATNKDTIIYSIMGATSNRSLRHMQGYRTLDKKGQGDARYRSLNICPWLARLPEQEQWSVKANRYLRSNKESFRKENSPKLRYRQRLRPDSTVEFRLHEGTHDGSELLRWTQLCVRIVEWCAMATDKDVRALGKNGMRALSRIAPDMLPYLLEKLRQYRRASPRRRAIGIRHGEYHLDPKRGYARVARAAINEELPF